MELDGIFSGMTVSASGLAAERQRLDLIARNIANAEVVNAPGQRPYRRQEAIFETVLDEAQGGGVRVAQIVEDEVTPVREIHDPSHPMADKKTGIVTYSNVNMAFEMVDMVTASRAYEANLKAMSTYREMVGQSLRILEG
jgi:flagellar basal-body rod protein FlgC